MKIFGFAFNLNPSIVSMKNIPALVFVSVICFLSRNPRSKRYAANELRVDESFFINY